MKNIESYGSWKSPISAGKVASGTIGLREIRLCGENVYWLETRPTEEGRTVLVKLNSGGEKSDVTPEDFNVRSRVHEYGGAPYLVVDDRVYFTNYEDQRVYRLASNGEPRPITSDRNRRFADLSFERRTGRIWAVCEDHSSGGRPENYLLSISDSGRGSGKVVASGDDFYSSPRFNPAGPEVAWLSWNHPNMPWDGTYLHVGKLDEEGRLLDSKVVAGSDSESVVQPKWSPEGVLYFISDVTGWWNIYRLKGGEIDQVTDERAEFSEPQWQFGISSYDFLDREKLAASYTKDGRWFLLEVDTSSKDISEYGIPYTTISSVRADGNYVWFIGGAADRPPAVRRYSRETGDIDTFRSSSDMGVDEGFLSNPEALDFVSSDGQKVHGFYYSPRNRDFEGPESEKPPLIVISHGGPTSATSDSFSPKIQYWTSRGFAVLDVNYRGSTGFGREYREELEGRWGELDVQDCSRGALYLSEEGRVDASKLIIRGASAGGYTTLAALAFGDVFDAGASYFGVSNPASLAKETHKFESRYLDGLIGPYPEEKELYERRSPIRHVEGISCPVIFFQGTKDRVVPPDQAEKMYESLKERGIATAYLPFEGERHGFKQEKNIRRSLEAELFFYSRVFGFELGEELDPVEIHNLD